MIGKDTITSETALYLTPIYKPYVGGAAVHFDQISTGLVDDNRINSSIVISAYATGAPIYESLPTGKVFRVLFSPSSIHRRWSKPKVIMNYILATVLTIVSLLVFRVSIVHTHTKRYFTLPVRVAKLMSAKIIVDGRDLGAPSFGSTGDVFVAASENIATRATDRREPIVEIPIGIDPDELTVECDDVETPSQQYMLFVGDIAERKGVPELLSAYRSNSHGRKLVMIGERIDRDIDMKSVDGAEYLGPMAHADVLCYIREADVVILPSIEEGLPRVILEAIFHETPVVCPPVVPEFRELLPQMTVSVISPEEIETTIAHILATDTSPDNYPIERHDISNVVQRYSDVYDSLWEDEY